MRPRHSGVAWTRRGGIGNKNTPFPVGRRMACDRRQSVNMTDSLRVRAGTPSGPGGRRAADRRVALDSTLLVSVGRPNGNSLSLQTHAGQRITTRERAAGAVVNPHRARAVGNLA